MAVLNIIPNPETQNLSIVEMTEEGARKLAEGDGSTIVCKRAATYEIKTIEGANTIFVIPPEAQPESEKSNLLVGLGLIFNFPALDSKQISVEVTEAANGKISFAPVTDNIHDAAFIHSRFAEQFPDLIAPSTFVAPPLAAAP